jgi:ribosome recycling factor
VIEETLLDAMDKMARACDHVQSQFLGVRTGRANASLVERIPVVIRLSFPMLTEERRKEYVKVVKNMAEDGRIALRNVRRDARKVLETAEKDGDISKDELDRAEKELDKLTQEHVDQIEKAFVRKEQELLEV